MAAAIVIPPRLHAQTGNHFRSCPRAVQYATSLQCRVATARAELALADAWDHAHAACLLGIATTWLAQLERDLLRCIVSEGHTDEFIQTLNEASALVAGAVAMSDQLAQSPRPQNAIRLASECIATLSLAAQE